MTPAEHWARPVTLLAIDPGARTGWAFFQEFGTWRLVACGVTKPDNDEWCPFVPKLIDRLVIENPQIYPNSKARPSDILTLARIVGRYEERFKKVKAATLVLPREWKGSIPGDVMTKRIEGALTPEERIVFTSSHGDHNTLDAIGLGKWALKQLRIMRAA